MKNKPLLNINLKELIKYCSLNNKREDFIINDFRLKNRENIHKVFKYQKFNDDFTDWITFNSNGKFTPCYDEFLTKLEKILNIPEQKDSDELTEKLTERLKKLRVLADNADLHNEFPIIYKDYQEGKKLIKELEIMKKNEPIYEEVIKEDEHYYYSCGLRRDLYNFITTQIELYKRMINDRNKYKEQIKKITYNDYLEKHFDMDKVNLYMINKYLELCENSNDRDLLLKYYKEMKKYLKSNPRRDISINIKNKKINFDTIVLRIIEIEKKLTRANGEVEWVFAPIGIKNVKKEGTPREYSMDSETYNRCMRIGKLKQYFDLNSPYSIKLYGQLKYKGYVAYIYDNGSVVLDTLYNSDYPSTAIGNAAFVMPASAFEIVSGLNKSELRINSLVTKINHTDTFLERIENIINQERDDREKEIAHELIKKYKK
ncbi:MAG: hypothetical protein IJ097_02565 [Bacilli bacterium]|nr:hypothetical protein [Bacilli bacterium]